jgi:putative peptidoglycan lipid II flippase
MIGHSMLEITARTFYAQQDTWTPLYVAVGAMLVAMAASVLLRDRLGVGGLALANAIGVTIEVATLLVILRRRLNRGVVSGQPTTSVALSPSED